MDDPNLVRIGDPNYSEKPGPFVVRDNYSSETYRAVKNISNFFPSGCLELVGSDLLESFSVSWHEYFLATIKQLVFQVKNFTEKFLKLKFRKIS